MSILELKNICYTYGVGTPFEKKAVNDVSFSVNKGELIGIIGHTGSGKSTLVQMLNGLMKPTSGQVLLDGVDIWDKPKEIRKIRFKVGMVSVSYTHLRAHETGRNLVCRLLLEKKKNKAAH